MKTTSRREFLTLAGKWAVWGLGTVPAMTLLMNGCKTMAEKGVTLDVGPVTIDTQSIAKTAQTVSRSFQDITAEQEYYIGRTVGGVILEKYSPYNDASANRYINILGQTLAQASDRPETFGGYHFLIQDSDEINALAAPGGLIFVTREILKCCPHEDAVAAVLAHEIAHVQFKHGLQAIKKSRVTAAVTSVAITGSKTFGDDDLARLSDAFEGTVEDITQTLIVNGYSRSFEYQADRTAVTIMKRLGYDPNAMVDMLRVMSHRLKPDGLDFARTHPSPADRIVRVQKFIGQYSTVKLPRSRQARFKKALGNI